MTEAEKDRRALREAERFDPLLDACPFCGWSMMLDVEFGAQRFAVCGGCNAQGPTGRNAAEAVRLSNRRAL